MRLIAPHRSNQVPHGDEEVIDLTDRLAPYERSAWRAPQPEPVVEPVAPAPSSLDEGWLLGPWRPEPQALDGQLDERGHDEAAVLEPALDPAVAELGSRTASPKQPRNERCACGSGWKYKRCCGQHPAVP